MVKRRWLTATVLVLTLGGLSACGNSNYNCVATCSGLAFGGYSGGVINAGSATDAANICVAALQTAGCVAPRLPACACVQQ
jgi:hypothetical protein